MANAKQVTCHIYTVSSMVTMYSGELWQKAKDTHTALASVYKEVQSLTNE